MHTLAYTGKLYRDVAYGRGNIRVWAIRYAELI